MQVVYYAQRGDLIEQIEVSGFGAVFAVRDAAEYATGFDPEMMWFGEHGFSGRNEFAALDEAWITQIKSRWEAA